MTLTTTEQKYLAGQVHGRLATVAPDGRPQNKPVGFQYNAELGTIDIYGFGMESSAKFRNIQARPDVALVVDDVITESAAGVRFLEIRGRAEAIRVEPVEAPGGPASHLSAQAIRIHPRRVIGWNLDAERPGLHTRDVTSAEVTAASSGPDVTVGTVPAAEAAETEADAS